MILSASSLSSLQSCPRRFLLEADWTVLRWRAKSLLDASLRRGILLISQGKNAGECAAEAKADFFQAAANPGLDLPRGSDPYRISLDYCAMIDTILRSAGKWRTPRLAESPAVRLNSSASWLPLSFTGEDGMLHRIVTVDKWDEAAMARELRGWGVIGDLCATRRAMILHIVEIGQRRAGRQSSAWCRAWRHPTMPNLRIRFARKDGTAFKGWTAYYLADHRDADAAEWVEQMEREGVMGTAVRAIRVDPPTEGAIADTLSQMLMESARGDVLLSERGSTGWRGMPMSRAACDGMVPCPFIPACHQEVIDLSNLGLYQVKSNSMLRVA